MLNISPENFTFLKTFDSEFSHIDVWFKDQNSKPVKIEDKINLTLVINQSIKMTGFSVQGRDRILVKGHGFLSFAKNMVKNIGKNISKSLNIKQSQKKFDHAKQPATDAFKTSSKRVIQKTVEATSDLIGNKIADKITSVQITRVSKTPPKNNSETNEEEILREKYR